MCAGRNRSIEFSIERLATITGTFGDSGKKTGWYSHDDVVQYMARVKRLENQLGEAFTTAVSDKQKLWVPALSSEEIDPNGLTQNCWLEPSKGSNLFKPYKINRGVILTFLTSQKSQVLRTFFHYLFTT